MRVCVYASMHGFACPFIYFMRMCIHICFFTINKSIAVCAQHCCSILFDYKRSLSIICTERERFDSIGVRLPMLVIIKFIDEANGRASREYGSSGGPESMARRVLWPKGQVDLEIALKSAYLFRRQDVRFYQRPRSIGGQSP